MQRTHGWAWAVRWRAVRTLHKVTCSHKWLPRHHSPPTDCQLAAPPSTCGSGCSGRSRRRPKRASGPRPSHRCRPPTQGGPGRRLTPWRYFWPIARRPTKFQSNGVLHCHNGHGDGDGDGGLLVRDGLKHVTMCGAIPWDGTVSAAPSCEAFAAARTASDRRAQKCTQNRYFVPETGTWVRSRRDTHTGEK